MKIEIFEEKKEPEKKPEKKIRLALKKLGDGVIVMAVDENGIMEYGGKLAYFDEDGTMTLSRCVSPELGFKLDKLGRIVLAEKP